LVVGDLKWVLIRQKHSSGQKAIPNEELTGGHSISRKKGGGRSIPEVSGGREACEGTQGGTTHNLPHGEDDTVRNKEEKEETHNEKNAKCGKAGSGCLIDGKNQATKGHSVSLK